jgi:VanZ family protein
MTYLWYLTAALIAYGSLYPFQFVAPADNGSLFQILMAGNKHSTSLADILGNIVLFVPYGLTGIWALCAKNVRHPAATVVLTGAALAVLLQVLQIYLPARSPALSDAAWNLAGLGLGIAASRLLALKGAVVVPASFLRSPEALLVLVLWLASELLPFVPSLDVQHLKDNLKALGVSQIQVIAVVRHGIGALLATVALETLAGRYALPRTALLFIAVALGKVLIVHQAMTLAVPIGFVSGLAAWVGVRHMHRANYRVLLTLCLLAALLLLSVFPLDLEKDVEPSKVKLPFAALLHGSMLDNARSLAGRLLLYVGTLWQLRSARANPVLSALAVTVWVGLLELIQLLIPGRTADPTEPIWVLLCAWGLHLLSSAVPAKMPVPPTEPEATREPRPPFPHHGEQWQAVLRRILGYALGLVLALWVVLRLPDIPYNVRELFHGNGSLPFLFIFALAALWPGASAAWAGHRLAGGVRPLAFLPTALLVSALVELALLYASVTGESLDDVVGSNNLYWFVTHKDIWGAGARRLFLAIGTPDPVAFIERIVRFVALVGPLWLSLAIAFACAERLAQWKAVLAALPWFWLFKAVTFDWSSTDNLNELIARDGAFGWGGGVYLYLLLIVLCANCALLMGVGREPRGILIAGVITLAALPLGWFLLNAGLEQEVEKYGLVFSGTQFLLGPDRSHVLSETELMLRWYFVQLGAVLTWAAGALVVRPLLSHGGLKSDLEARSAASTTKHNRAEFVKAVHRAEADSAE